jgi:Protein of unknown function (DUF669)
MAGFSLDFNDTFEGTGGKIADGDYEVVVNRCSEGNTPGGAEYVEFDLIIRNDVNQAHKNQHIFHKVWKAKETGKYNMKTFNTIGKACNLQNGKSYKSLNELLDDYVMKTALVNVKNETSEYNGKTYENTNVKYWNLSKITGPLNHKFKSNDDNKNKTYDELTQGGAIEIKDDDLPF